jgi:hypothetical protein
MTSTRSHCIGMGPVYEFHETSGRRPRPERAASDSCESRDVAELAPCEKACAMIPASILWDWLR